MISENQFLIGHLSPKLFNHLGFNEIYQDPRQNFYLCRLWISWLLCQAPLQGLIPFGSLSTTDTFSSITHYSYYQEVSRYSSWLHYGLHITPHRIPSTLFGKSLAIFSCHQTDPKFSLSSSNWRPNWKVDRILKDTLRSYIIHYDNHEDKCPFLAEFSPRYQAGLKMALFKASYDQRCQTPLGLSQTKDH